MLPRVAACDGIKSNMDADVYKSHEIMDLTSISEDDPGASVKNSDTHTARYPSCRRHPRQRFIARGYHAADLEIRLTLSLALPGNPTRFVHRRRHAELEDTKPAKPKMTPMFEL